MEDFFTNLAKFFGGLAGDRNTNAGLSVHEASPKNDVTGAETEAYKDRAAVPFTYKDTATDSYRSGMLFVPSYATDSDVLGKDLIDNRGTVSIYGAELDDGTELDYKSTIDFLDSLNKNNDFRISKQALVDVPSKGLHYDPEKNDFIGKTSYKERLYSSMNPGYLPDFIHEKIYPSSEKDARASNNVFIDNLRRMMRESKGAKGSSLRDDNRLYEMLNSQDFGL